MLIEAVKRLIRERPGSTGTELARAIYGLDGYSERIGPVLRALRYSREIERCGSGGSRDPYRYYPAAPI